MTKLHNDWLTEGILDFEYKKYVLMAYLQHIGIQFTANKLYPYLPELKLHFDTCVRIRANQQAIRHFMPKDLKGVNVKSWELIYEDKYQEDSYINEFNQILDYAIPGFSKMLEEGTERFSEVGENIKISPVGIVPLRIEEGYLFFCHTLESMITIFQYELALYTEMQERYLKTVFVDSVRLGFGNSLAQIKVDLVKRNKSLPNPATYIVESKYEYPLQETLLPVAKKMMLKQMNVA
ncbi:hypothetical protein [Dyadobacter sp. CY312]|uniref:hypothetical protein n=1 Tax=Dyadobacter sp. CY312 TaxID=2907303 RepID=UPI001F2D4ED4|nr:hypothetical protein [Dyadobacter sp. CY312]MCE7040017.1 hypothetical protein [Dyadobacter sp. CY312]